MIIKIKTFSGENLYLSEEDYLNEVMYSELEERNFDIKTSILTKAKRGFANGFPEAAKKIEGVVKKFNPSPRTTYNNPLNPSPAVKRGRKVTGTAATQRRPKNIGLGNFLPVPK